MSLAVQATNASQSGSGNIAAAFGSNNTSGNVIVVMAISDGTSQTFSISDSQHNSYTSLEGPSAGQSQTFQLWIATGINAGANTVTVNSSGAFPSIIIVEYPASLGIAGTVDKFATAGAGSGTALSSGATGNTSQADELLISYGGSEEISGGSFMAGMDFALEDGQPSGSSGGACFLQDQQVSSIGSYTGTATMSPSGRWDCFIVTLPISPTTPANLASAVAGTGTVSAPLLASGVLAGSLIGSGSVSAKLVSLRNIAADVAGSGSVSADAIGLFAIAAALTGSGSFSAGGIALSAIEAALAGAGSVSADLTATVVNLIFCAMRGRGSVVAFPTLPPMRTFYPPNNPRNQQKPYILKDFGVSLQAPAYLSTSGNDLQLFYQTSFVPNVNAGLVIPPTWSPTGTPDNFNYQGRVQAPGELLVAPDNGSLSGKIYKIVAQGTILTPSSAVNPSFNLVMNQNYFAFGQAPIADVLFQTPRPIPLIPGTAVGWMLFDTLSGNGPSNGTLGSGGILWVGGTQYFGSGGSQRLVGREPQIQLSMGIQFNGSVSNGEQFQAFLSQFQMFNMKF